MNEVPRADRVAYDTASAELLRLESQVEATRAALVRLLQDVVQAESRLGNSQAAQLLAANEELVLSALRLQADADTSAQALTDLHRSSELDPLTQLPNRVLLLDRLTSAIAGAKRHGTSLALMFVDLNHFKDINDSLGHAIGDQVLKIASRCLLASVREMDTVSRHGGDEFLILLPDVSSGSHAAVVANKALDALGVPTRVGGHVLRLSASIGISLYPEHGMDADTLIARADAAMYRAKSEGVGSFVYEAEVVPVERDFNRALKSLKLPFTQHETALAKHELVHAEMQEANEQLVLSSLNVQDLLTAAEQANRRQTEFLAIVAHELRNPLAPIRLASSMLGRLTTEEPLLVRAQEIIDSQTRQLARLIEDLLDVSRANTGTLRIEMREVDLVDIIDDAINASRPGMDTRLQSLDVEVPSQALTMRGDTVRLVQIFTNLLNNASKYTPNGGKIALTLAAAAEAFELTVSDNGIGISAEVLPNIFEPFVQDTHAIGFNGGGLGVGLTVVRQLVGAHGGTIKATSAGRGRGSKFVVSFPRGEAAVPQFALGDVTKC